MHAHCARQSQVQFTVNLVHTIHTLANIHATAAALPAMHTARSNNGYYHSKVYLRRIARLRCVCNAMHCGALLAGRFVHVALYHLLDLLPHTRAETGTEQRMYPVMHESAPN